MDKNMRRKGHDKHLLNLVANYVIWICETALVAYTKSIALCCRKNTVSKIVGIG